MKQVLQNLKNGRTELVDVPVPSCKPGHLLIATRKSLVSAGTERMLVEFGQGNILVKAKAQPEKVRQVLEKIKADGLMPTIEAVFARLDQPLPLGYCNSGIVVAVGEGVGGFSAGDRVVSNGPHAEFVCAPKNLCAHIPEGVDFAEAAFTVLASVGLQGIRLSNASVGESVVVMGLGLVGLMTVQILLASGVKVLGFDYDPKRCDLAKNFGAEAEDLSKGIDPVKAAMVFSKDLGIDAVLITASTKNNAPVSQAAHMCRKRGRIILVGVSGLELNRSDFYEKELSFQVSCSYGPGRYDESYEIKGNDYPLGYVRWTEQRNFEAVLDLICRKKIDLSPLISHEIPFDNAHEAYDKLVNDNSALGIILDYHEDINRIGTSCNAKVIGPAIIRHPSAPDPRPIVGVIGAGNFSTMVMLPALSKIEARLKTVSSEKGMSAAHAARKFGFENASSDYRTVIDDPEINTVFILTRHDTHASFVCEALKSGKHVFVEKPVALTIGELSEVRNAVEDAGDRQFMVGFNRRFAPLSCRMKRLLESRSEPVNMIYTVNAGHIPLGHWTRDKDAGGGRIVGEACHFIDLERFLTGEPITGIDVRAMSGGGMGGSVAITMSFADGSTGTVHYLTNGSKSFRKEHIEIFSQGRVLVMENFKSLRGYGWKGFSREGLWGQDKGHVREVKAFMDNVVKGGSELIPWHEIEEVTKVTFEVAGKMES